jgi:hypothetical protein
LSLIVAGSSSLYARDIKGVVLAESDSTAVIGALCELKVGDKVVAKSVADGTGAFVVDDNVGDAGDLVVSMTGFGNTEIFIPSGSKNIDLGAIYLSNSVLLNELTVNAQQVTQGKQGRTIVIPSSSVSLFAKLPLPGLDVDKISRKLKVDGGTPVLLIDGVPSTMDDYNALQAKDIERVEYSRITPARYADKGNSGLINVILKQRNDGGSVYAWLRGCPTTGFLDGQFNATYHQGPSQFSLAYSPSWRNYQSVYDDETETLIGDDFTTVNHMSDRNPFNYFYNQIRAKYNYHPTSATLFSATFSMYTNTSSNRSIGNYDDTLLGTYTGLNKTTDKELSPSLDLFLRHDFNDKNTLEVEVVGTLSSDDYNRKTDYEYPDGSTVGYQNMVENRRRSLISEVSYNHYFSQNTTLSAGVQNTLSHTTNTYLTSDYKPVLTENNNYIYAKLGQQVGKVYLSLSTGMKLYWMKNDLNDRNFVRNLSQVYANWNINNRWGLQAGFAYTPIIPGLSALTDYVQQQSQYQLSNGNPNLRTTNELVYQFMPAYNYKKFSTSLLITYRDRRHPFMNMDSYVGDGLFLTMSDNYKYRRSLINSLFLKVSDIHGFGARANVYLDRYWMSGDGWNRTLTSVNGNISLWWNKGPVTISYYRKFPGKVLNGYYVSKEENNDQLEVEYKPNKHWTLTAGWWYMFEKKGTKYPSWSYSQVKPYVIDRYIKDNGNMVVLSVSYTADFGTIFNSGRRSLNNSDTGSSLFKN